ncbi:MAG: virulence factor SrfB [Proteobacteria bacterium]|nr:virulence factor SrfB [Pseudomonadota bacterium]
MALAEIPRYPDTVSIIPESGIQFLDFGFSLALPDGKRNPRVPSDWGFFDPRPDGRTPAQPLPTLLRRGDADLVPGKEDYAVDLKRLVRFVAGRWLPLPLLREEPGGRHYQGPVNWARCYLTPLPERDRAGNDHRLIVALDTNLMEERADTAYLAPSPDDARNGRRFSLPPRTEHHNFFVAQGWVRDWVDELFRAMLADEERRRTGRRDAVLDEAEIAAAKDGPNEPLARYMALLELLGALDILPRFRLTDTITAGKQTYVDVEMVLDLGNSRTCGLLVEAEPGSRGVNIDNAFRLELRDLSRPEQVYSDPFDSRLEFALARFGLDHHAQRSGRSDAFTWPTIVRVGPEAVRLAGSRRGSEGHTGMSSPKRYLWDESENPQPWRFNGMTLDGEWEGVAAQGKFATLVNDAGKPLHLIPSGAEEDNLPSLLARYSRSNLVTFALAEVLMQALVMMNAPAQRLRRRNADLPRRLRRLILTMPSALSLAERQLLKARAEAARDLVYLCIGRARRAADGGAALEWLDGAAPEIVLKWDEASATQLVYLYSQVALAFSGDARGFFAAVRAGAPGRDPNALRIATLDIGGGTTDLVITTHTAEGSGANVTVFPRQDFRESFNVAGDDIVRALSRDVVVASFARHIQQAIGRERTDVLVQALFGGNRGDMTAEEQLRRQQFATQIAAPVVVAILGEYEGYDALRPTTPEERPLGGFFPADAPPPPALCAAIERSVREAGAGDAFRLLDLPVMVDMAEVDRIVRSLMTDVLRALSEVACRYNADLMLLSGRPSRLPAVRQIVVESGALAPHRVIAMHEFRVGQWYPFRSRDARITDPKTTAAVGAMICLLAEGHMANFNFRSDRLGARSVARFLGKIETSGRLRAEDVYYADLDLEDPDWALPETGFEFRGPMTLGVRQFPAEWWPATLLYAIDYQDEAARQRLQPQTPLTVQLKRERVPRVSGAQAGQPPEVNDRLAVDRIEGARGSVPKQLLAMRLQTMRNRDGYWLDTGILLDV